MTETFGGMAKRVRAFAEDLRDAHEAATTDAIRDLQNSVRRQLIGNDSIARRMLLRDIRRDQIAPQTTSLITAQAVHLPEWAKYLEFGTGSKGRTDPLPDHIQYKAPDPLPPQAPILTWIRAKNVTARDPRYKNDPEGLANAIANEIGNHGTMPRPFYRPAWYGPSGKQNIEDENEAALSDAVDSI